ncbi:MAG: AbrB/MazE/SpoVT family DNA-binding domain-containing protein [Nitrospirae bacterium]|nr:AbrB/MazE/SpoVT family DNA-binding domain-containing protein [Nitrospirota bacterium]
MSTITKKGQVTIPKPFRDRLHIKEGDSLHFEIEDGVLILKRKERKSLLSLGGIAKGRKVGSGSERDFAKKAVARKIAREGL